MPVVTAFVNPNVPVVTQTLGDDPSGLIVGPRSTSLVGFFGSPPVVQPLGGGGLAGQSGTVQLIPTAQTPALVAANTTAEQALTFTGAAVGQLVLINKPSSQAGLLVGTGRVSAINTVQLTFGNITGAAITPTAAETYDCTVIAANMVNPVALTPAAVAANTTAEQQFNVVGLPIGGLVAVNKPTAQAGLIIVGARVVAAGVLGITYANVTGAAITPTAAETYLVYASRGLQIAPVAQNISQTLTPSSVAPTSTSEQTFTVPGLVAGAPVWVDKPSVTTGLGIAGVRVSAANTLAINFVNVTATAIVPPSEAYVIQGFFSAATATYSAANAFNDHANLVAMGLVSAT